MLKFSWSDSDFTPRQAFILSGGLVSITSSHDRTRVATWGRGPEYGYVKPNPVFVSLTIRPLFATTGAVVGIGADVATGAVVGAVVGMLVVGDDVLVRAPVGTLVGRGVGVIVDKVAATWGAAFGASWAATLASMISAVRVCVGLVFGVGGIRADTVSSTISEVRVSVAAALLADGPVEPHATIICDAKANTTNAASRLLIFCTLPILRHQHATREARNTARV